MTESQATVLVECDAPARMRDGVVLRADIYRPAGAGPWPTLLVRTPYGKHVLAETMWNGLDPLQAARDGFLVVVQDTRGRFASDGEWQPLRHERFDGYDSIEWAGTLPGSNGRVGTYGGSYCGNTQLMPAIDQPSSLAAISPMMTWSEPLDGLFARGGAVELGLDVSWSLLTGLDHLQRLTADSADQRERLAAMADDWDQLGSDGYWGLPVNDIAVMKRHATQGLGGVKALDDPEVADWCRVAGRQDRINVPSLHTGGWYDIFLKGTLDNYEAMAASSQNARLIVGPWAHERFSDPIGEQVFGLRSGRDGLPPDPCGNWTDFQLAWFRRHLASDATVELPSTPVRIFVMGRNEWRGETAWPPERVSYQRWFLRADGALTTNPPRAGEAPNAFVYDPDAPVPTVGGATLLWPGYPPGPMDQRPIEARQDVLAFTSECLERDLEITGPVRVVFHGESSAPSTDWVARLCDVHPDGRSICICDGILRISDRAEHRKCREIDLWATSNVFLRGHRLRVVVTSSSFPRWDRNLNTGDQRSPRREVAHQLLHHALDSPSYVLLPVIQ